MKRRLTGGANSGYAVKRILNRFFLAHGAYAVHEVV